MNRKSPKRRSTDDLAERSPKIHNHRREDRSSRAENERQHYDSYRDRPSTSWENADDNSQERDRHSSSMQNADNRDQYRDIHGTYRENADNRGQHRDRHGTYRENADNRGQHRDRHGTYRENADNRGQHRDRHGTDRENVDSQDQHNRRPYNSQGYERGGRSDTKPFVMNTAYLKKLQTQEPSEIILILNNGIESFRKALKESTENEGLISDILCVLAKAFSCASADENLNRVYTTIKDADFLDTSMNYFLGMPHETSEYKQRSFKQPIKDMITIMSQLNIKHPTSVTQFIGIHEVLKRVINSLQETAVIIDNDILEMFRECTEHSEQMLTRHTRTLQPRQQDTEMQQDEEVPPNNFRDIQIFPQIVDVQTNTPPYLRANKVKGGYQDLEHYLDVQFRLLREDFVAPLREGISEYLNEVEEQGRKSSKFADLWMYYNVKVICPECSDNGLIYVLQFDVSRSVNVHWRWSKRLIFGSLVCLSPDNFQTIYCATVVDREVKMLEKGIVKVKFEYDSVAVDLFQKQYTMAETTTYFESYRHVLNGLQNIRPNDLPFEKYVVNCETEVEPPGYLRRRLDTSFDLRPLVDEDIILKDSTRLQNLGEVEVANVNYNFKAYTAPAKAIKVLDKTTWPPPDLLHLDASQYTAVHTALTKEFAIIQGPPGTGKTYIGLKIIKALLHNRNSWSKHPDTGDEDLRPMLIVCYTNHALDQFLEGILNFYKGDVLRVGGRSNSEKLKPYNLHNFKQAFRLAHKIPLAVFRCRREVKLEMDSLMEKINQTSARIQTANTSILHERILKPFMNKHYHRLQQQFPTMSQGYEIEENSSSIVEWLCIETMAPPIQMEGNIPLVQSISAEDNNDDDNDNLIDVEGELDTIQAQRELDDNEDFDYGEDFKDVVMADMSEPPATALVTRKEKMKTQLCQFMNQEQKAVALDVERIAVKPMHMELVEWQTQKQHKRNMQLNVQRRLADVECMTEEEADKVIDVMRLSLEDKWRLYRYWIKKYCDSLLQHISEKEIEFDDAARRYMEILMQEDKEIMKHSTVIGMTTTGAARYQAILQEIKPRIIIVEEAAEVLEAHTITTLTRGCEHLILIGDHKQLKPNPTVYKLAKDYNLDVSLFERMINNGIPYDCLELQHRMRPEIAELMKRIYPSLRDDENVKGYENIKGISENICFVSHNEADSHDPDSRSHSNVHEAKYIVALCKYLLLQGYKPEQITVLTLYSGQLFCLRSMMPKEVFKGVKVTVVDNYQGEENDIVLLSLVRSNEEGKIGFLGIDNRVCVALSRAKKGFYAIGNFNLLKSKSNLWNDIVTYMKVHSRICDGLLLTCQNHPDYNEVRAKRAADFDRAPEGGCVQKCSFRLPCGHGCEMFCHVIDKDHAQYVCKKKCERLCENYHPCPKPCSALCGSCQEKVAKQIPRCRHVQEVPCSMNPEDIECNKECAHVLKCGHTCQSKCGMTHTENCNIVVDKPWACGHNGQIKCFEKDVALCPHPCGMILTCEHPCKGTCGKCFQGRLHRPCLNNCKRILVCGHECTDKCNQCSPCRKACENRCQHSKCRKRCGELCIPCKEPCDWRCKHLSCSQLCSKPCDRKRCDKPCTKLLPCQHQCIGLCGEPCPPDCRTCDREKVHEIFFGNEDDPNARFVLLQDCKTRCIIESEAMDRYMDQKDENREIKLKECPKCKTPIRKSTRYRAIINKLLLDIEDVKLKVLMNESKITFMEEELRKSMDAVKNVNVLQDRLDLMQEPKSENAVAAMQNQIEIIRHLNSLEEEWKRLHALSFKEEKKNAMVFLKHFRDWALEERTNMTSQEISDAELELSRNRALLKLFLHQQKALEMKICINDTLKSKIQEAEKLIKGTTKYEECIRITVEQCLSELQEIVPVLSEEERVMIVNAMAMQKGHWFKCPNGHVYAIGECGGAMEVSKCPDCNAAIGGTQHRLIADNLLAEEMDDADYPAWSEQANLANYDNDNLDLM